MLKLKFLLQHKHHWKFGAFNFNAYIDNKKHKMQTSAYMCYLLNTWNKQLHEQETTDTQTKHKQYTKTLRTLHK